MDLAELIERLSEPSTYPGPVETVEVHQTHISVVFLAGSFAYKVKKPVDLGFIDYGTLERRRHFCQEEVRLNRRLASEVYLGVVPITREGDSIRMEGTGEVVEWAVKMKRLPDEATLRARPGGQGTSVRQALDELACRIAQFHANADSGDNAGDGGSFETIARNARENFEQSAAQVGVTVSKSTLDRLELQTEARWPISAASSRTGPAEAFPATRMATSGSITCTGSRNGVHPATGSSWTASSSTGGSATPIPWPMSRFSPWNWRSSARGDLARSFVDAYLRAWETSKAACCCRFTRPTARRCAPRWKA